VRTPDALFAPASRAMQAGGLPFRVFTLETTMDASNLKTLCLALMLGAGAIAYSGCAVTDRQTTVGQAVDDGAISARVKARMAQDPNVSAMRIEVETLNGVVQLAGFATSQAEKERAASLARDVPNVREVRNNIIVRPAN
jgi:hyperosmotically inducible periplasmic protein